MQSTKKSLRKKSVNKINSKHVKPKNVTNAELPSGRWTTQPVEIHSSRPPSADKAKELYNLFHFRPLSVSLLKLPFTKSSLMFLTFWRSGVWIIKILMLAMCAKSHSNTQSNKCSAHTYSGTLSSHCWHPKPCTSGVNQQKLHKHTHKNTNKNRHTHGQTLQPISP